MAVRRPTAWILRRIGPPASISGVADFAELKEGATVFGRSVGADVYLDSKHLRNFISRRHATVVGEVGEDGQLKFVLHNSGLNGTYINDVRMGDRQQLREGDKVTFGHKNGYKVRMGEKALQPDSEFQFVLEQVAKSPGFLPTNITQMCKNNSQNAALDQSKNQHPWQKEDYCCTLQGVRNYNSANGKPKLCDDDDAESSSVHSSCVDGTVSYSPPWMSTESSSAQMLQNSAEKDAPCTDNYRVPCMKEDDDNANAGQIDRRRKNSDNSVTRSPPHAECKRPTSPAVSDASNPSQSLVYSETLTSRPGCVDRRPKPSYLRPGNVLRPSSPLTGEGHSVKLSRIQSNGFETDTIGQESIETRSPSLSCPVRRCLGSLEPKGSPEPRSRIAKQPTMPVTGQQPRRPNLSTAGFEEAQRPSPESIVRTPSPSFLLAKEEDEDEVDEEDDEEEEEMEVDEESASWDIPPTPGRSLVEAGELCASPQTSPYCSKQKTTPRCGPVEPGERQCNPGTSPHRTRQEQILDSGRVETRKQTPLLECRLTKTRDLHPSPQTSPQRTYQDPAHTLAEERESHSSRQISPYRTKRKISSGMLHRPARVSVPLPFRTAAMKKMSKDAHTCGEKKNSAIEVSGTFSNNHRYGPELTDQSQQQEGSTVCQNRHMPVAKFDMHGATTEESDSSDDDVFHCVRAPGAQLDRPAVMTAKLVTTATAGETSQKREAETNQKREEERSQQSMARGRMRHKSVEPRILQEKENGIRRQHHPPVRFIPGLKTTGRHAASSQLAAAQSLPDQTNQRVCSLLTSELLQAPQETKLADVAAMGECALTSHSKAESVLKDVWVAVERVSADNIAKHSHAFASASSSSLRAAKPSSFTDKTKSKDGVKPVSVDKKKHLACPEKPNIVKKHKQLSLVETPVPVKEKQLSPGKRQESVKEKVKPGFTLGNFLFPAEEENRKLPRVSRTPWGKKVNKSEPEQGKNEDKDSVREKNFHEKDRTTRKRVGQIEKEPTQPQDKDRMVTRDRDRIAKRDTDRMVTRDRDRIGQRDRMMTRDRDKAVKRETDRSRDRKESEEEEAKGELGMENSDGEASRERTSSRSLRDNSDSEHSHERLASRLLRDSSDSEPSRERISSRPVRKTAIRRPRIMMDSDQQEDMFIDSDDETDHVRRRRERRKRRRKRKGDGDDKEEESLEDGVTWYEGESCESGHCTRPSQRRVEWVQCDDCDKWYHTVCVGCNFESIKDEEFHCGCL